jgi:hypothetical protein
VDQIKPEFKRRGIGSEEGFRADDEALAMFNLFIPCFLIWGIPTIAIAFEKYITWPEKRLWIIANAFLPWLAYLAFLLLAPIASEEKRDWP